MGVWDNYLRWRHSKGYGVHSPYAFRFVKDVINPGRYGFYGYDELEDLYDINNVGRKVLLKDGKLIIRMVNFLKTGRILSYPSFQQWLDLTSKAANVDYKILGQTSAIEKGDLLVVFERLNTELLKEAVSKTVPLVLFHPGSESRRLMENPIENGLLINGKNIMILVPRPEMNYVAYKMRI